MCHIFLDFDISEKGYPFKDWSARRGSNPRPSAWEADALPTELLAHARTSTLTRGNFAIFLYYVARIPLTTHHTLNTSELIDKGPIFVFIGRHSRDKTNLRGREKNDTFRNFDQTPRFCVDAYGSPYCFRRHIFSTDGH